MDRPVRAWHTDQPDRRTYGSRKFVAIGEQWAASSRPDGITWTENATTVVAYSEFGITRFPKVRFAVCAKRSAAIAPQSGQTA